MSKRKRSAEPRQNRPLEFLLDRGLGRMVSLELERLGWLVHRIADEFPDDAQDVADEDWIEYGLQRGWVPLSKLRIAEMVERFHLNRDRIERAARRGGPAIHAVSAKGVRKVWP